MAEGWTRHLKHDVIESYSAGIETHGLNQRAVTVMAEAGVDISKQYSKQVGELKDIPFDYVITVCGHAHETCPFFPGKTKVIHAGFDEHGDYDVLLQKAPDLKLILAHAGFPLYSDTWKKIKNNKNVYVDLCQTSYLNDRTTKQAIEYLGVERCLFGTDGPYGVHGDDGLFDYSFIKRRIERLFPDKEIQKKILGENFLELIQK